MSKPRAVLLWKCSSCDEVHGDEDSARECCMPEVYELYGCPKCGVVHEEEHQAISCCEELVRCPCCARDYGAGEIHAFAVRIAGHCNQCNPFYSLDHTLLIEDQYAASGAEPRSLNS
ncbi:MAG: hypothetical protein WA159_25540 [Variovorax sp.]